MDLWRYLLPNLDGSAVIGLAIVGMGVALMWFSTFFSVVPSLRKFLLACGGALTLGGAAYWVITSFFRDVWENAKARWLFLSIIGVAGFAWAVLRKPERRNKK